jgi:hypothetical protein
MCFWSVPIFSEIAKNEQPLVANYVRRLVSICKRMLCSWSCMIPICAAHMPCPQAWLVRVIVQGHAIHHVIRLFKRGI